MEWVEAESVIEIRIKETSKFCHADKAILSGFVLVLRVNLCNIRVERGNVHQSPLLRLFAYSYVHRLSRVKILNFQTAN